MTVFGQQVEVSTNETISGRTTLHGLTKCDFSNAAILLPAWSEWNAHQPPVLLPSSPLHISQSLLPLRKIFSNMQLKHITLL